ncbi:MAG: uracil-DNA glycosylase [Planctomycetaceae bacterium]|nr:uracil-DNA glycosylase [Planctomycetaceae bacterium]
MSDWNRLSQQLLRDCQSAGLSHLPRVAPLVLDSDSRPKPPPSVSTPKSQESMPKKKAAPTPVLQPQPKFEPTGNREQDLEKLAACVADCIRCPELAKTRTQTVFGVGDPQTKVMFLGEAPGADEDKQGEPFVGRAGQLLNKIIAACGWTREELYICNILRCRPPGNRTPNETEAANCREYLDGQIAVVDPEYIVCWGSCAAQNLLATKEPIGRMRQRFFQYGNAKVLCTYHPSYLLRNPAAKKPVWEDMKFLLSDMGLTPPSES